jgi:DNA polymerase-1
VASFCRDGVEADDVIASVARRAATAGADVVIASSDKDFMQLVAAGEGGRGGIGLLNPNDRVERIWGAAEVRAKTGVAPEQIVDWLALMGDAVDNIPGVPGVGPKTAAELLGRFGSVDGIYARLGEVRSERLRGALAAAEADVRRNVNLVRLRDDVAVEVDAAALAGRPPQRERLAELYRQWGFRSLLAAVTAARQEDLL